MTEENATVRAFWWPMLEEVGWEVLMALDNVETAN
jgi:hypothetical protein